MCVPLRSDYKIYWIVSYNRECNGKVSQRTGLHIELIFLDHFHVNH